MTTYERVGRAVSRLAQVRLLLFEESVDDMIAKSEEVCGKRSDAFVVGYYEAILRGVKSDLDNLWGDLVSIERDLMPDIAEVEW